EASRPPSPASTRPQGAPSTPLSVPWSASCSAPRCAPAPCAPPPCRSRSPPAIRSDTPAAALGGRRDAGQSGGAGAEDRPADLGPVLARVVGVGRANQVVLPDRSVHADGALGHDLAHC